MSSYPNGKTGVQTNNYTTIVSHASISASTPKYKRQQIISMTVQISECTKQSPISYILKIGAIHVLIDNNRYNNNIKQQLQEDARTQQVNVII